MDKSKSDLLNQLRTLTDYVDRHYEEISEGGARSALTIIHGAWGHLERRKGERRQ